MAEVPAPLEVTVRFFAAARAAAGAESDLLRVRQGATVADVVSELCCRSDELARVLQRCSYLCDGIAVRNSATELRSGQTIDVLPPFAGG
ncbi:MoaD/ThiS family protein [Mycolicibacterium sphagni]|uniref:Molybdopterin synthase sulfur carrier subunit n=1 Tax=Mycolicibacterium sphagni TaxID=1786 RepID=A0A255DV23_9MYCO|nr:MoaD/ThiS family protein [Mycolicibacterium sphagni]MCV7179380.1 MoaD/ThiS family protein [Mycolicibacterium sphagni]OYN82890.1 molybdopterin synthase sulfur carrier subunit [Mycolicibacterium sphagni]